jgi:hypothetical protein
MLKNEAHVKKEISHLFPHHTWRQMDIVITKNDFWTLANIVIANPTHTNLVQLVLSMTMHVATIAAQDKT